MNVQTESSEVVEGTWGKMIQVDDFLPSPDELVLKERPPTEKITLVLDSPTVDFFRTKATELGASYQRMIRNLLNEYVARQEGK